MNHRVQVVIGSHSCHYYSPGATALFIIIDISHHLCPYHFTMWSCTGPGAVGRRNMMSTFQSLRQSHRSEHCSMWMAATLLACVVRTALAVASGKSWSDHLFFILISSSVFLLIVAFLRVGLIVPPVPCANWHRVSHRRCHYSTIWSTESLRWCPIDWMVQIRLL
jgi:hypothetical protein